MKFVKQILIELVPVFIAVAAGLIMCSMWYIIEWFVKILNWE
jgi:hypothetical protein